MEYEIGSLADLITGTVTPNRPKLNRKALTPVKHKQSPKVTPRGSEALVNNNSFSSPSVQKRKNIVKKSPKRIFGKINSDLDTQTETLDTFVEKKKLNLEAAISSTSTKQNNVSASKDKNNSKQSTAEESIITKPPRNKKKRKSDQPTRQNDQVVPEIEYKTSDEKTKVGSRHNNDNNRKIDALEEPNENTTSDLKESDAGVNRERFENFDSSSEHESDNELESETELEVKNILNNTDYQDESSDEEVHKTKKSKKNKGKKVGTTNNHEEVEERNEETVREKSKEGNIAEKPLNTPKEYVFDETERNRTIFVGNVPFSRKCKKDLKKIFSAYGVVETVRFRTIPTKDEKTTPKLAIIKGQFHPERATVVNAYIRFQDIAHATQALAANNTVIGNNHIRVTRGDATNVPDSRFVLFVGNLPFNCEEEDLRSTFDKCGVIDSVRIIRDKKTLIGKGFGYVNFKSADAVELGLGLSEDELKVKDRVVRVRRYLMGGKKKQQTAPTNTYVRPNRFGQENKMTGAALRLQNKEKKVSQGDYKPRNENDGAQTEPHRKRRAKEFLGQRADKKKKRKITKTTKQKKNLSEILTKGM